MDRPIPVGLQNKTDRELANIINSAVGAFSLPDSWRVSTTVLITGVLLNHIDEMCNEFGLTPDGTGRLVKAPSLQECTNNEIATRISEWSGPGMTAQGVTDLVFAFSRDSELWTRFQRLVNESAAEQAREMNVEGLVMANALTNLGG